MKKVLSLDVGVTTGFAVHTWDEHLVHHGDVHLLDLERTVKSLRDEHQISYSVAERPVIVRGKLGDQLVEAMSIISHELVHQVVFIDSAQWKSTPWAKAKTPPKLSTHERDAIRLGLWYLSSLKK